MTPNDWARIVARAQEATKLRRWARYQRRNGDPVSAIRLDAQAARAESIVKLIAGVA
jgi:hypothetical protein